MSVRLVSKYRDRSSRTSSASRLSDSVVNPTRSANSTDTSRRSEDGGAGAGLTVAVPRPAPTGVPHSPQNFSLPRTGAPQAAHAWASGFPHSTQNFLPAAFSVPQFGQVRLHLQVDSPRNVALEGNVVQARAVQARPISGRCGR